MTPQPITMEPTVPTVISATCANCGAPIYESPNCMCTKCGHVNNPQLRSQLAEWGDLIRSQGEESRARQDALNARFDKIITELEAVDPLWFMYYEDGPIIARVFLGNPNDHVHKGALSTKRNIIAKCVIPAMYACIRAGLVTPKEQA